MRRENNTSIYQLYLHDQTKIEIRNENGGSMGSQIVTRVPNGWIYQTNFNGNTATTFVADQRPNPAQEKYNQEHPLKEITNPE